MDINFYEVESVRINQPKECLTPEKVYVKLTVHDSGQRHEIYLAGDPAAFAQFNELHKKTESVRDAVEALAYTKVHKS